VAPTSRLPAEELELLVVLARYPQLLRSPEAARAGDLLVHPLARQLYRAAAEQAAETGTLEIPTWLDAVALADRTAVAAALNDDGLAALANPAGYLGKLVTRLEILRVDAEISMKHAFAEGSAGAGDEDASNALSRRGVELRQTKEGLKTALQRP
jgi:hypothetical protein